MPCTAGVIVHVASVSKDHQECGDREGGHCGDHNILLHVLLYVGLCDGLKEYRADIAIGQRPFEGGKIVAVAGVYQSLL